MLCSCGQHAKPRPSPQLLCQGYCSTIIMQDTWRNSTSTRAPDAHSSNKNADAQCLGSRVPRKDSR